jgi:ABC-type transport system substrate-binding protein
MHRDPLLTRARQTSQHIIEIRTWKVFVAQGFDYFGALGDIGLREPSYIEKVDFVVITEVSQFLSKLLIGDGVLIGVLWKFGPGQERRG